MKLIAIILSLFGSSAFASTLSCQISEQMNGKNFEQEVQLEFVNKTGNTQIQTNFGLLHLSLANELVTVTTLDPKLKKTIKANFGGADGDSSRLQIMPNEKTNDYIMMDCQMDGQGLATNPKGANCSLIETVGSQSFSTKFEIPIAQNGHDFTELPTAKLAPLAGWVMMYNGLLISFVQNKELNTGITTMGYWNSLVGISWFPSTQNIKVDLSCTPIL